jgi:hypothetical protein
MSTMQDVFTNHVENYCRLYDDPDDGCSYYLYDGTKEERKLAYANRLFGAMLLARQSGLHLPRALRNRANDVILKVFQGDEFMFAGNAWEEWWYHKADYFSCYPHDGWKRRNDFWGIGYRFIHWVINHTSKPQWSD